jgi:very-long-chain enoyl-CoA reductase
MTQTLTAFLFTIAGGVQMTIWVKQQHWAYKKEFVDKYPKQRKEIIPFLI